MLNNVITFKNRNSQAGLMRKLLRFHVAAGLAGMVNYSILLFLARGVGLWDIASNIIGIGFGVLINYLLNSRWTWKEQLKKG